jgi:hypothetical protein
MGTVSAPAQWLPPPAMEEPPDPIQASCSCPWRPAAKCRHRCTCSTGINTLLGTLRGRCRSQQLDATSHTNSSSQVVVWMLLAARTHFLAATAQHHRPAEDDILNCTRYWMLDLDTRLLDSG